MSIPKLKWDIKAIGLQIRWPWEKGDEIEFINFSDLKVATSGQQIASSIRWTKDGQTKPRGKYLIHVGASENSVTLTYSLKDTQPDDTIPGKTVISFYDTERRIISRIDWHAEGEKAERLPPDRWVWKIPPEEVDQLIQSINDSSKWRASRFVVQRIGQAEFRQDLLNVYGGKCCLSGCTVESALEAAHIIPYTGPKSCIAQNGLLLRADLHSLFDSGLLSVDPEKLTARLYGSAKLDPNYSELDGKLLSAPEGENGPHRLALTQRFMHDENLRKKRNLF